MKISTLDIKKEISERQKELKHFNNPELIRFCIRKIKQLENLRVPPYELPAESWIRFAVIEMLLEAEQVIDSCVCGEINARNCQIHQI